MFVCEQMLAVGRFIVDRGWIHDDKQVLTEARQILDCCDSSGDDALAASLRRVIETGRRDVPCPSAPVSAPAAPPSLPPLIVRGWNFAGAMATWAAHGFPRRTRKEIEERLAICQGCDQLVNDACAACGCACTGDGVIDALVVKTKACPLGKWK